MTGGQIGNVDLVKQLNSAAVYRLIDQKGPISRIQVAEVSQLAPASVTKITRQLLERGLIKEVAQQASTGGRRAISLTTESEPFHAICVRVGRRDIDITLYDLSGKAITSIHDKFDYQDSQAFIEGLIEQITQFKAQVEPQLKELVAIGVTLPGLIDPVKGVIQYMPTIDVEQLPLGEILNDTFNVTSFVGNDIRALALAEHYFGATRDCLDSIVVSVHNGTGAGIIVNGQVFLGHNRNVGEIGHIQIDPLGDRCQCGNFGCLETVAANPAIIAHVEKALAQGFVSELQQHESITVSGICHAANNGDELAVQVLTKVGNHLGKALAITINLFNPQKIVLTGEITEAESLLFAAIERCISTQALSNFSENLVLASSELYGQSTIGSFSIIKRAMLNGVLLQKMLEEHH
uniref:DNA-binding transcriptional regulator NagC n=1 Tax=Thaumasiovibrio occultus TaxID=1891184 RepID=UPI000B36241E|nr:ROK family protein [Thaumasiovibrio occultus]